MSNLSSIFRLEQCWISSGHGIVGPTWLTNEYEGWLQSDHIFVSQFERFLIVDWSKASHTQGVTRIMLDNPQSDKMLSRLGRVPASKDSYSCLISLMMPSIWSLRSFRTVLLIHLIDVVMWTAALPCARNVLTSLTWRAITSEPVWHASGLTTYEPTAMPVLSFTVPTFSTEATRIPAHCKSVGEDYVWLIKWLPGKWNGKKRVVAMCTCLSNELKNKFSQILSLFYKHHVNNVTLFLFLFLQ